MRLDAPDRCERVEGRGAAAVAATFAFPVAAAALALTVAARCAVGVEEELRPAAQKVEPRALCAPRAALLSEQARDDPLKEEGRERRPASVERCEERKPRIAPSDEAPRKRGEVDRGRCACRALEPSNGAASCDSLVWSSGHDLLFRPSVKCLVTMSFSNARSTPSRRDL